MFHTRQRGCLSRPEECQTLLPECLLDYHLFGLGLCFGSRDLPRTAEEIMPALPKKCRKGDCKENATRGAYYIPVRLALPKGKVTFGYTLLCASHGKEALAKGAKKMNWRPKE